MDATRHLQLILEDRRHRLWMRFLALGIFAIAMAYLESAVVEYLRMIYYPEGFEVILKPMPLSVYLVELGREAATMVMLFVVARLAFRSFWLRFSSFLYLFAIWDIFYYIWLFVFIRWPSSLTTWDILFLIPVAWIGPVWSPLLVSLNFILASITLNLMFKNGIVLTSRWYHWIIAIAGAAMIFYSYVNRVPDLLKGIPPTVYSWKWLVGGLALGWVAFGIALVGKSWIRVDERAVKGVNSASP
ncbi:MAG: hypothetical protein DSY91_00550 [Deltaproteobacteria bacterium]|nr:MAG: hypothetical protein DSY91_00550 [Deltaproteobacteria bacterium]